MLLETERDPLPSLLYLQEVNKLRKATEFFICRKEQRHIQRTLYAAWGERHHFIRKVLMLADYTVVNVVERVTISKHMVSCIIFIPCKEKLRW